MATVLVVDDVRTDRDLMGKVIAKAGHNPIYATDGDEVHAEAKASSPSLILLDVMMLRVDGITACRLLKQNPATQSIPVILVTSKPSEIDQVWGRKQGAADFLAKPYTSDELVSLLKRYLG
jgi:CheY-like chemotaxis protein